MQKQINKIKLAITTKCNLNCDYCFVKKTNEDMGWGTAKNAIDLLLESEGEDKLLSIYGGEPLLNFRLIEKICPYAILQAKRLKKNLTMSICTNATLLEKERLDFFRKYGVRLIISLVGEKADHDKFRNFGKDKGSYEIIARILPMVFKKIPPEYLGVSFCLFPSTVQGMKENFNHLLNLGFNYINFEIIHHFQDWHEEAQEKFQSGLNNIIKLVLNNIPKGNFIFLNPINWEIKYQKISQSMSLECPFWYKVEIYPSGAMAFSPFLLNSPNSEKYLIGNINQAFSGKFKKCQYSPGSPDCQKCQSEYFPTQENVDRGAEKISEISQRFCLKAAEKIKNTASGSKEFSLYIQKIKKEVCF